MTVFRGSVAASSPVAQCDQVRQPITFSQDLFGSEHRLSSSQQPILDAHSNIQSAIRTVNPASLSPELRPVAESSNASSFDTTQHSAAMLCDLQCLSTEHRPWMASATINNLALWQVLVVTTLTSITSSLILSPMSQIYKSLTTHSSLSPTPSLLAMIIWVVTTSSHLTTSTLTTSFITTKSRSLRPKPALRIRLLRRLLACSPFLARPLMDATLVALRSASEQKLARDCLNGVTACDLRDNGESPSVETLMTLLWAIKVIAKEQARQTPKLDAAAEVGQAWKLDNMFRLREMTRRAKHDGISLASSRDSGTIDEKSLGWMANGV